MVLAQKATYIMLVIEYDMVRSLTYLTSFSNISFMKIIPSLMEKCPCRAGWRQIECRGWMYFWSSTKAGFATISRSKLVIGSSFKAFFHTLLLVILDPTAPLVKSGACAMAAWADQREGSKISKFSLRILSSRLSIASSRTSEVLEGTPQSKRQKFSG